MRFSLRLNNDLAVDEYIILAQAAEKAGFDQFWVSNDLFLRSGPVILAALAQSTHTIEIGSCIFNPYTINPAEIAMLAATLDELSGNRFNLGLAAGAKDFLEWVGIRQEKPLNAMRESVEAIRHLLSGERAEPDGRFLPWTNEAYLRFEAPRITPIYIGALGPNMLALAGEIADGVLPLLFPPEHYFGVLPYVQKGAKLRANHLSNLDLAACIWVSLDEDYDAARHVLAKKVAYYGPSLSPLIMERLGVSPADFGPIKQALMVEQNEQKALALVDERMMRVGVVGTAHHVIERLEKLVDAGVQHLSFGPPLGPNPLNAIALLGKVIERFTR
ncbi:MAG: LLM class flavin-dependent oxidoreductase [Chloroflexota bacterium]